MENGKRLVEYSISWSNDFKHPGRVYLCPTIIIRGLSDHACVLANRLLMNEIDRIIQSIVDSLNYALPSHSPAPADNDK